MHLNNRYLSANKWVPAAKQYIPVHQAIDTCPPKAANHSSLVNPAWIAAGNVSQWCMLTLLSKPYYSFEHRSTKHTRWQIFVHRWQMRKRTSCITYVLFIDSSAHSRNPHMQGYYDHGSIGCNKLLHIINYHHERCNSIPISTFNSV